MKILKLVKIPVVTFSFAVLAYTLFVYDGSVNSDAEVFLIYSMAVITFPAGLISIFLLSLLFNILSIAGFAVGTSYVSIFIVWLFCFLGGVFQWHYLFPKIKEYISKNRSS